MAQEVLKPVVIPLNGKLVTSQDPMVLDEGDFQELTNMRYGETTPQSIYGMTRYNSAAIIDTTYLKTRSGFHFKKDNPTNVHP
jgi:hypothetical protein